LNPRFTLADSYRDPIAVDETVPWRTTGLKSAGLRIGWRCIGKIYDPDGRKAEAGCASVGSNARLAKGHLVHANARVGARIRGEAYIFVDLWSEQVGATAFDLRLSGEALELIRNEVCKQIEHEVTYFSKDGVKIEQEFLEINLPDFIVRHSDPGKVRARLATYHGKRVYGEDPYPTLVLDGGRLRLGPEFPGVIGAVRRFLEDETSDRAIKSLLTPLKQRQRSQIPFATAMVLLGTWVLPLQVWAVALVALVLLVFLFFSVYPSRQVGWRVIAREPASIAMWGFFGIGAFGIGYAICALLDPAALGPVNSLGYPFLVSTGLGIAGGILGDNPKGAALILAHVQLLLFLGGLMGVVAVLLEISDNTRRREQ
jgi:hypothetical protein